MEDGGWRSSAASTNRRRRPAGSLYWSDMATKRQPRTRTTPRRPIRKPTPTRDDVWERLAERARSVPASEWARVPRDAAARFDEYLEGEA